MGKDLVTREQTEALAIRQEVGQAANEAAARAAFTDYRSRKSRHTIRRQNAALVKFSEYLAQAAGNGPSGEALASNPEAWRGVTWGLVEGFVKWLLVEGYAVSTVNLRLSTVKTYAKLATKAGALSAEDLAMIRVIDGYSRAEGKRLNGQREAVGLPTRVGDKKQPIVLSRDQIDALKALPDLSTPQGRRDAVLLGLMLDLGLRVGEVVGLAVGSVDLEAGQITFYRPKVDKEQTHDLINGLQRAMRAYVELDALAAGQLLRSSVSKRAGKEAWRAGQLSHGGMTTRAITDRVRYLGEQIGIEGLSAHDLRHTWATRAAPGTPIDRLQDAGGWSSYAMPLRYIEAAKVANEGIKLS